MPEDAARDLLAIDDRALAGRNHFHPIRLAAALLVLFAHCFHLLDRAGDEPIGRWFLTLDASLLGVTMFFFISGFLVARSWDLRQNLPGFLVARALRIAPALWLALALTVFVLGPLFTTLPLIAYFADPLTWKYLGLNAVLRTQYLLPGVFEANPLAGVNGSLWTIPLEVTLYVILGVAGWTGLLAPSTIASRIADRARASPLLVAALIVVALLLIAKVARTGPQYARLASYFVVGVAAYRWRARIPLSGVAATILVAIAIAAARHAVGQWLLPLALPYAILVVALHPSLYPPRWRATWLHRHDYSYGTYLYGFPLQQAAIQCGVREPALLLLICVPLTLLLAALSWHLIERRALTAKSRWTLRLRSLSAMRGGVANAAVGDRETGETREVTPPRASPPQ